MKNKSIEIALLIGILSLMPMIQLTLAADVDYVGVEKDDEFIWRFNYDKKVIDDYEDDTGANLPFDEDMEGYKVIIEDADNKETESYGYKCVILDIKTYETKNFDNEDDWKKADRDTTAVYKFDKDLYVELIIMGAFILANDIDWEKIVDNYQDDLDDENDIKEADVAVAGNGMHVLVKSEDKDVKDVEATIRYTTEGVLELYEIKYNGQLAASAQLQGVIPGYPLLLILGILGTFTVGIVINLKKKQL